MTANRVVNRTKDEKKSLGLYEMDEIDRDLFAGRLNDLNQELDFEFTKKSKRWNWSFETTKPSHLLQTGVLPDK